MLTIYNMYITGWNSYSSLTITNKVNLIIISDLHDNEFKDNNAVLDNKFKDVKTKDINIRIGGMYEYAIGLSRGHRVYDFSVIIKIQIITKLWWLIDQIILYFEIHQKDAMLV